MSPIATTKRLRTTGLAFAVIMTLLWQGPMLMGFDRIAERGDRRESDTTVLAKQTAERAVVTLERVVVTTRRA